MVNKLKFFLLLLVVLPLRANPQLDDAFLRKTQFLVREPLSSYTIEFLADSQYLLTSYSGGLSSSENGRYRIERDFVRLEAVACDQHTGQPCNQFTLGSAFCIIQETPSSVRFNFHLHCTPRRLVDSRDFSFPIAGTEVKTGQQITLLSYRKVVVPPQKSASTTGTVKIRDCPSIQCKSLEYFPHLFGLDAKPLPAVPPNVKVVILARTMTKEKIDQWENYWYLVDIPEIPGSPAINHEVWIFGQFLKMD